MICAGKNLTVFQLESRLLCHWSKQLLPRCVKDIALLISIVRPGVLEALDELGRSMAEVICLRKNGKEEISYYHPSLEPILKDTYGVIVYQEQISRISRELAGFSPAEAEDLRKIVSKKDQEKLAKIAIAFVDKAVDFGILNREQAQYLMDQIRKSGRYAFNRAHAMRYALVGYETAFLKAHHLNEVMCSALKHAENSDEIAVIIEECKSEKIDVCLPSILKPELNFFIDNGNIRFGLASISGLGESNINNLIKNIAEIERIHKPLVDMSWYELLVYCCHKSKKYPKFTPSVIKSLIEAGGLSHLGVTRRKMIHELSNYLLLSPKEQDWNIEHIKEYNNLPDLLVAVGKPTKEGGGTQSSRLKTVEDIYKVITKPPNTLNDTVDFLISKEKKLLGINLTASRLDKFDTSWVNAYVSQVNNAESIPSPSYFATTIIGVKKTVTKKGRNPGQAMCMLRCEDQSGSSKGFNFVVFPKIYEKYSEYCEEGNVVIIHGERSGDSLFVNEIGLL